MPQVDASEEIERIHVWLHKSDVRWLDRNVTGRKRSEFVREAVRQAIERMDAKRLAVRLRS